jgi:hypothetical protein
MDVNNVFAPGCIFFIPHASRAVSFPAHFHPWDRLVHHCCRMNKIASVWFTEGDFMGFSPPLEPSLTFGACDGPHTRPSFKNSKKKKKKKLYKNKNLRSG